MSEITHWECGEAELEALTALQKLVDVRDEVRDFVNANVILALKDYARGIALQFGDTFEAIPERFDPDAVYVFVCDGDGDPDEDGNTPPIGKRMSLRAAIIDWLPCIEKRNYTDLARHLEDIAAEIRKHSKAAA